MVSQLSVEERFWSKVDKTSGIGDNPHCWAWIAATVNKYGVFCLRHGKQVKAHRQSYELLVEQIPDGMHIDHLCRNPSCVNPAHMEPVTHLENTRRGMRGVLARQKSHCIHGHSYDGAYFATHSKSGNIIRMCVTCRANNNEKRKASRRARQ